MAYASVSKTDECITHEGSTPSHGTLSALSEWRIAMSLELTMPSLGRAHEAQRKSAKPQARDQEGRSSSCARPMFAISS